MRHDPDALRHLAGLRYGLPYEPPQSITVHMPASKAEPLLPTEVIESIKRYRRNKPACGPKETRMSKWIDPEGREMRLSELRDCSGKCTLASFDGSERRIIIYGDSKAELYARARKCGCTEVVEPHPCPVCGSEAGSFRHREGYGYRVCCKGGPDVSCEMVGPMRKTKEESVKVWNRLQYKEVTE